MDIKNPETNAFLTLESGKTLHFREVELSGWNLEATATYLGGMTALPAGATEFGSVFTLYSDIGEATSIPFIDVGSNKTLVTYVGIFAPQIVFKCDTAGMTALGGYSNPAVVRVRGLIMYYL